MGRATEPGRHSGLRRRGARQSAPRLGWEHSEHGWLTADECYARFSFRGLREGLDWTRREISERPAPAPSSASCKTPLAFGGNIPSTHVGMHFRHSTDIWDDFPELVAGALVAEAIAADASVQPRLAKLTAIAERRLAAHAEGALPEIRGWRRAFSRMGVKPTQYRCASEALLRRYRKEGSLPQIHPLVDLCNAVSLAFAIPVAVFDVAKIADYLEVRYAAGSEIYDAFSGETEFPEQHEVVFADGANRAHARRWTNRQSAYSAVRRETRTALIVAEAMHASAHEDVQRLVSILAAEIGAVWSVRASTERLTRDSPRFEF
jgi:DNA/RNA-binding domain of Phe-tRNA-synthetase-like protein